MLKFQRDVLRFWVASPTKTGMGPNQETSCSWIWLLKKENINIFEFLHKKGRYTYHLHLKVQEGGWCSARSPYAFCYATQEGNRSSCRAKKESVWPGHPDWTSASLLLSTLSPRCPVDGGMWSPKRVDGRDSWWCSRTSWWWYRRCSPSARCYREIQQMRVFPRRTTKRKSKKEMVRRVCCVCNDVSACMYRV
mgnify:FL=1